MAGRPAHFTSVEELQQKIDEYFDLFPKEQQTITGLALFLGFESRQSFYDYEKVDQYSYIIKRARLSIEHAYELKLSGGNCTGAIFALKNMGWMDKSEQKIQHEGGVNLNFKRVG
jgi:hypothetical protein